MSTPIEILRREHRVIERALRTLDGICVKLQRGIEVPPETLSQLIDFIRTYADGFHHGKEEAHLFPALVENGVSRDGGVIGMMLEEHEAGRAFIAELTEAAQGYKAGDPRTVRRFVLGAWRYMELLTMHIHKEENVLFVIADEVLDDEALASLSEAFEMEDVKLGAGLHKKYERIAAELERAWAA
ncbi:MAG TPA: hemerythrin domain-containing protein [Blastocatellia bacterium]|nr:hemerythrin domain-containing protein [Blastocatellia bacterium]